MRWFLLLVVAAGCGESAPADIALRENYLRECQVHAMMASRLQLIRSEQKAFAVDAAENPSGTGKFRGKLAAHGEERLLKLLGDQRLRVIAAETALYSSEFGD